MSHLSPGVHSAVQGQFEPCRADAAPASMKKLSCGSNGISNLQAFTRELQGLSQGLVFKIVIPDGCSWVELTYGKMVGAAALTPI